MELLNRYKKYWMAAGAVLALLVCYQLAFKKTMIAWQLHNQLEKQVAANSGLSVQPAYLERQYRSITELAASYRVDTANYRTQLLGKLAPLADTCQVTLTNIPKSTTTAEGRIVRQQIGVEGDFFSLLRFFCLVEKQKGAGMASSVSWKKISASSAAEKKTGRIELTVCFYGY